MKALVSFYPTTGRLVTAELKDLNTIDNWCDFRVSIIEKYNIHVYKKDDGGFGCSIHFVHKSGFTDLFRSFQPTEFTID